MLVDFHPMSAYEMTRELEPDAKGGDLMVWGPGMAFISVSGIVLGCLWLLGCAAELIPLYVGTPSPLQAVYSQTPLGVWRWCSLACGLVAGGLALFGGIDGVRKRSSSRRMLGIAAILAATRWLGDLVFWGAWCMGTWDSLISSRGGMPYTPYYVGTPNPDLKSLMITGLIASAMTSLAWVITVLLVLRRRQAVLVEAATAVPALAAGEASESSLPSTATTLSYRSPQANAAWRKSLSLQAPWLVVKALFVLAVVLGALGVLEALGGLYGMGSPGRWQFAGATRAARAWIMTPGVLAGIHVLDLVGALTLLVGGVLGARRRVGAGRVLVFCGISILFFGGLALFQRQMDSTLWNTFISSGRLQSQSLLGPILNFFRSQLYAIICLVALSRRPRLL